MGLAGAFRRPALRLVRLASRSECLMRPARGNMRAVLGIFLFVAIAIVVVATFIYFGP